MSTSHAAARPRPDATSASAIAAYKKRRSRGDYGVQPNAPSIGIKMDQDAFRSANKATSSELGPVLWYPKQNPVAYRASELASASENLGPDLWYPTASANAHRASALATAKSAPPDAIYVENPSVRQLASIAATSAIKTPGEVYGERENPEAYKFARRTSNAAAAAVLQKPSLTSADTEAEIIAANRASTDFSAAMAGAHRSLESDREARARARSNGLVTRSSEEEYAARAMDYTKIMASAEARARNRLAEAMPAGDPSERNQDYGERREQVLSLITIADRNVKKKLAELDHDTTAQQRLFGASEYQRIAMDVAARSLAGRLDNHGKVNLGGGLFMNPDEIDDIARQHVQPVLDKVEQVAQKKRIVDRETATRAQIQKKAQEDLGTIDRLHKGDEKAWQTETKNQMKQVANYNKQKAHDLAQKAKKANSARKAAAPVSNVPPALKAKWDSVEQLKDEVKQAKTVRGDMENLAARAERVHEQRETDLKNADALIEELSANAQQRTEEIETMKAEDEPAEGGAESVALFEKQQELETLNLQIKFLKQKRDRLESIAGTESTRATDARAKATQAHEKHHDMKKQYFDDLETVQAEQAEFEEAERQRLEREAEERRIEQERIAKEREEQLRLEQERLEQEQQERERLEAERAANQEAAAESGEIPQTEESSHHVGSGIATGLSAAGGAVVGGAIGAAATVGSAGVSAVGSGVNATANAVSTTGKHVGVDFKSPSEGYPDAAVASTPGAAIVNTEKSVVSDEQAHVSNAAARNPAATASAASPAAAIGGAGAAYAATGAPDLRGFNRDGGNSIKNFFKMFRSSKPGKSAASRLSSPPVHATAGAGLDPISKQAVSKPVVEATTSAKADVEDNDNDLYEDVEDELPIEHVSPCADVETTTARAIRVAQSGHLAAKEEQSELYTNSDVAESKNSLSSFKEAHESVSELGDSFSEHKGLPLARTKSADSTSTVRPAEITTSALASATSAKTAAIAANFTPSEVAEPKAETDVEQAKTETTEPESVEAKVAETNAVEANVASRDSIVDDRFKDFDSSNVEEPIEEPVQGVFKENFD